MYREIFLFKIIFILVLYLVLVISMSKKNNPKFGLFLPIIFGILSIYYYIKPYIIHNPYPTMKEAIYSTSFGILSFLGFLLFIIIKLFKNYKKNI